VGITDTTATFLIDFAREAPLGRTATLGRLELFLDRAQLSRLARSANVAGSDIDVCAQTYSEPFLKHFAGATQVVSVDFSPYEGAGIIHDMNVPIPRDVEQQFDTVIDGGTLEHVFNFPVALANCMRLLRPGGRLFMFTPGNSLMGHGFYQFSPELLYRALSPQHGFEVRKLQAVKFRYVSTELASVGAPLDVQDPAALGTRTVVASSRPVSLHVCARKLRHLDQPFDVAPQQSDYVEAWNRQDSADAKRHWFAELIASVEWRLPGRVKWPIWNTYGRLYRNTLRNRRWFVPARGAHHDA
jgi:SAM-dependent methyltransferase